MIRILNRRELFSLLGRHWRLALAASAAVTLALKPRLVQIGAFVIAAGLGRIRNSHAPPYPGNMASKWGQLARVPIGSRTLTPSRSVITYHPWYQGFDVVSVSRCLEEAARLGVGYIRTDVRWRDILPDRESVNKDAISWYRNYFTKARESYGLRPLVVLANPPSNVTTLDETSRLFLWTKYVEQVAVNFSDLCDLYQVLNEPTNPAYEVFSRKRLGQAVSSAAKLIHAQVPGARVAINILVGLWGWKSRAEQLLVECSDSVDMIGLDYFPGTWTLSSSSDWRAVMNLFEEFVRSEPGSPYYGRKLAILETGYATNIQGLRNEHQQSKYFQVAEKVFQQLSARFGHESMALVGFYELCDSNSSAFLDPEAHFGLLTSGSLDRKLAFVDVQRICRSLRIADAGLR